MLFLGLQYRADKAGWERINAESYSKQETILLKLPMALPYQGSATEYEPMHGQFEHAGEFYKGIKQKLESDTLYIICVKDNNQKHIAKTMDDYAKVINDLPAKSKPAHSLLSKLIKEYTPISLFVLSNQSAYSVVHTNKGYEKPFNILKQPRSILSPPPEKLSA